MEHKKKLVLINQHEEGIIRATDPNHDGLLTFGLDTCVAVIIKDKRQGICALQHIDVNTEVGSISDVITKYDMSREDTEITLVFNKKRASDTVFKSVMQYLHNINLKPKLQFAETHGVCVFKDGSVDNTLTISTHEVGTELVVQKNGKDTTEYECEYYGNPSEYIVEKNLAIANLRIFGEEQRLFTRYEGGRVNTKFQDLPEPTLREMRGMFKQSSGEDGEFRELMLSQAAITHLRSIVDVNERTNMLHHMQNIISDPSLRVVLARETPHPTQVKAKGKA
jgi:hypothetical protein